METIDKETTTRFVTITIKTDIECKVGHIADYLHRLQSESTNVKHFGRYSLKYNVDGCSAGYPMAYAIILIEESLVELHVQFTPNTFYGIWLGEATIPDNQIKNFLDIFEMPRVIDFVISEPPKG